MFKHMHHDFCIVTLSSRLLTHNYYKYKRHLKVHKKVGMVGSKSAQTQE